MSAHDETYAGMLRRIMDEGVDGADRTGVGTRSVFGGEYTYDLADGFPLLTTKKIHFKSVLLEAIWMLRGITNAGWLSDRGVTIWDEWADESGELGPVYGRQWRSWPTPDGSTVDQIERLVRGLREDPRSRRHVVTAWNPADLSSMALPPCHAFWQMYSSGGVLSCKLTQRSADAFLGVPFNIASYSLITCVLAKMIGQVPGRFIHSVGDLHVYSNHVEQVETQLARSGRSAPTLELSDRVSNFADPGELEPEDASIVGYDPWPAIAAPVAV
jgi:thymidylate synthase